MMTIYDLFSKRQKKLRGEIPDVYTYDDIPQALRVQIVHILTDTLGNEQQYKSSDNYSFTLVKQAYDSIYKILCKEYGVFSLGEDYKSVPSQLFDFFLKEKGVEKAMDFIELSFRHIDYFVRRWDYWKDSKYDERVEGAIQELNGRFKEHGVGYEYKGGEIIRIDSQFIHSNAVIPALSLLAKKEYKVANEEFMKAHEHYRHQQYKDAITWALKSFESTMKVICEKRKWGFDQKDTAKKLIDICFQNGLIPQYLQSHFTSLQNMLTSGIPVIRNTLGGHGGGTQTIEVPGYMVEYCLHITASTLLFMIEAEEDLKK